MSERRTIDEHADLLWKASESGTPIDPLTETDPGLTVEDAYAIQLRNVARAVDGGRRVVGMKVGLTSKAMQEMLGVSEPDFGTLLDDMVLDDGAEVSVGRMLQPRVEAEIGLVLGRDLAGPGVTTYDAVRAISVAVPALEIIDSRVRDWKIRLVDTVADNGSSALAVLGGTHTPIAGIDLRLVGGVLEVGGVVVEQGTGAAALGHPAACVAWLANKLAEFGQTLTAGQVVLPGAVHRAVNVKPGDVVRAEFAGLGSVRARFVAQESKHEHH